MPTNIISIKATLNIDWQDEVFGTHPVASYLDLSVNGGTGESKIQTGFYSSGSTQRNGRQWFEAEQPECLVQPKAFQVSHNGISYPLVA